MRNLEERIAHLTRSVEDLSDVVARQAGEIAALEQRIGWLLARAAEAKAGGTEAPVDRPPPHW